MSILCQSTEYGEQEELAYLVMPYVTGGTLRHVLEKRAILPLGEVIPIIDQAAAALDCAHAQGIIHRDLKPGNILFHADGRVLLADFGLAKVVRQSPEQDGDGRTERTALTNAGTIVGTPEYFSPEQSAGHAVDARSDVYALGIVLFQMLTGDVPFTGASPVAVAIKHTLEELPSLAQLNPTIPPEVEAVVKKALAKKPAERYTSAGEFAQALRTAASTTHQAPLKEASLERVIPQTLQSNDIQLEVDMHEAATEEAVRIRTMTSPVQPLHIVPIQPEVLKVTPPQEPLPKREQPPQRIPTQVKQHSGCQSVWMMLLGSLLTLLLVVGGFAMYLHLIPQPLSSSGSQIKTQSTVSTNPQATAATKKALYARGYHYSYCFPCACRTTALCNISSRFTM